MAQYAPQAGISGSTAIPSSSPLIKNWATGCTVVRGFRDIAKPDSGYTSAGTSADAIGAANYNVVSLGDSGVAVLTFPQPIANGAGPDFAVFENGFPNPLDAEKAFLELAFVEVSSDGVNYERFPARSLTQTTQQLSSIAGQDYSDARYIHNLAGKYIAGHGTPFDLAELAGRPSLDIAQVTHVRIVDVIGSVGAHASFDDSGSKINDPYPTLFPTGGFDLDAVAVLNTALSVDETATAWSQPVVYPNPCDGLVWIRTDDCEEGDVTVMNAVGKVVLRQRTSGSATCLDLSSVASGLYRIFFTAPQHLAAWSSNVYKQ
jgi:hypothetical protein